MKGPELVYDLHVRRDLSLPRVARVLRLSVKEVREFWRRYCAKRAPKRYVMLPVLSPRTKADFAALRERVCLALWETVMESWVVPVVRRKRKVGDGAASALASVPGSALERRKTRPLMVSIRIRALKMIEKLYGVGGKKRGREREVVPVACATPEEIAEAVREWRERRMKEER
jgi:hypothetical protein